MARKGRELAPFYFRTTATAPLFFPLAPQRRAPPFSVSASGQHCLSHLVLAQCFQKLTINLSE